MPRPGSECAGIHRELAVQDLSPKAWYQAICDQTGFVCDDAQTVAIEELEALWQQLVEFKHKRDRFLGRSLLSPRVPRGLYIWGGVGRGKTFLMDGFYHCLPYRRKRRIHFHQFIAEVHAKMKRLSDMPDPLMALADDIADTTRLLCLDEFHVDDIADAMILGRLLAALFKRGVVLLITSNYPPDELYPNGLQRQNFLPAIELLKHELKILHFDGNRDYRLLHRMRDPVFMDEPDALVRMEAMFHRLTRGCEVAEAGNIPALRSACGIVWYDFNVLCKGNHDQSDYLRIAGSHATVFLSGVPYFSCDNADEARRFAWLIDVLYDNRVKLVASFARMPENLYETKDGESLRIISRLMEMQTQRYLELPHRGDNAL